MALAPRETPWGAPCRPLVVLLFPPQHLQALEIPPRSPLSLFSGPYLSSPTLSSFILIHCILRWFFKSFIHTSLFPLTASPSLCWELNPGSPYALRHATRNPHAPPRTQRARTHHARTVNNLSVTKPNLLVLFSLVPRPPCSCQFLHSLLFLWSNSGRPSTHV